MARKGADRESLVGALRHELEMRPEIVFAYLHGSFLAGGAHRDIDVAVWLDLSRVDRGDWHRYALDLSVGLHLGFKQPVDVRALNDAPLSFR